MSIIKNPSIYRTAQNRSLANRSTRWKANPSVQRVPERTMRISAENVSFLRRSGFPERNNGWRRRLSHWPIELNFRPDWRIHNELTSATTHTHAHSKSTTAFYLLERTSKNRLITPKPMEIWIYLRLEQLLLVDVILLVTPRSSDRDPDVAYHRNIPILETVRRVRSYMMDAGYIPLTHLRDPCFARNGWCLAICHPKNMPHSCRPPTRCSIFSYRWPLSDRPKSLVNYLPWTVLGPYSTGLKIPFSPQTKTDTNHAQTYTHTCRLNWLCRKNLTTRNRTMLSVWERRRNLF